MFDIELGQLIERHRNHGLSNQAIVDALDLAVFHAEEREELICVGGSAPSVRLSFPQT